MDINDGFMDITDGLWFRSWDDIATTTREIPVSGNFSVWYNDEFLGAQLSNMDLIVEILQPYLMALKKEEYISIEDCQRCYQLGQRLTIEDFEIIANPDYKEE